MNWIKSSKKEIAGLFQANFGPWSRIICFSFAAQATRRCENRMHPFRFLVLIASLIVLFTGCATQRTPSSSPAQRGDLILTAPGSRLVYQRGLDGNALLPIAGEGALPGGTLQARLIPTFATNKTVNWQLLGTVRPDGSFNHALRAKAGWYRLEVRVKNGRLETKAAVDRVGVGEVFIVVGHSVAHGGRTNLAGATDDRVNTIAWPANAAAARKDYERTADTQFLPPLMGTLFSDEVAPAPFGHGTYFWAQFAERVARSQDVPVLLLNAAFGGTSLEHWAKSARGEAFEHSFVKSPIRMPYINLHHALRQYAAATGVRAILADQGQNDWPETDGNKVFDNYVAWVKQARDDLGFPELAIVVNRATPPGTRTTIRQVQERMIREVPHCFAGPDYDTFAKADRYDGVHLSESGMAKAAQMWADALTANFFQRATPYQRPSD